MDWTGCTKNLNPQLRFRSAGKRQGHLHIQAPNMAGLGIPEHPNEVTTEWREMEGWEVGKYMHVIQLEKVNIHKLNVHRRLKLF